MTYAEVNGQQVYYEVHGSGKPLVALHGGLLTIDLTFGHVLPWLTKDRQVVAVELQGHGHTPDNDRPLTLPDMAADVIALLDHLGIDRADLFGFSLGSLVAAQVAMSGPSRVDRLVLAAGHFRSSGYHDEILDPALMAASTRMPTADDFAEMRDAYLAVAPHPEHFEAFMAKLNTLPPPTWVDAWSLDELRAITTPTLLVVGDRDFVRLSHADEMRELLPDAQLAVLPNSTHMRVMHHELLQPLVEKFLA
jgi:pimeloyl-ACP methyl ester carboxylesterase